MSYLLDTNVLIYYFNGDFASEVKKVITSIIKPDFNISVISKMEFLGFTQFMPEEKQQAEIFISNANILTLEDKIVEKTIKIKQTRKIKLPDAIIAATALHHNMELITNNVTDFKEINIIVHEPFSFDLNL